MVQRKRPRSSSAAIALLSMAVVASILYLQQTTNDNEQLFFDRRYLSADDKLFNGGGALIRSAVTDSTGMTALHKISHSSNENSEEEYNAAFAAAWSSQESEHDAFDEPSSQTTQMLQIQPYTLEDTLNESQAFNSAYTILIYNPPTDKFYAYYSNNHQMKSSNKKTYKMIRYVTYMLRSTFPEKFTKDQPVSIVTMLLYPCHFYLSFLLDC